MTIDSSLPIGTAFGEFQIQRELGEGTFGSVYEARWARTRQRVALKVLHRKHLSDRDAVERFLREAEALRLLDHPHVVDVLAFGEQSGVPYIVLEFLDGVALDQRSMPPEPLAVGDALDIMLPVISAVEAFHKAGIVHRDLKPGNIFLVKDTARAMIPKVLDFGLAKMDRTEVKPGLTLPLVGMGTPNYMSPEQIRDARSATPLSDQFSLGVILYFLLTGRKPFDAATSMDTIRRVLEGRFERPSVVSPSISSEMEQVVLRSLKAKPEDRFPSLRAMARALLPYAHPETRAIMARDFADPNGVENPSNNANSGAASVVSPGVEIGRFSQVVDARRLRAETDRRADRGMLAAWMVMLVATGGSALVGSFEPANAGVRSRNPPVLASARPTLEPRSPAPSVTVPQIAEPVVTPAPPTPAVNQPTDSNVAQASPVIATQLPPARIPSTTTRVVRQNTGRLLPASALEHRTSSPAATPQGASAPRTGVSSPRPPLQTGTRRPRRNPATDANGNPIF
jgi:eukaryotic-like serine/threonine-protein kinase